MASRRSEFRLRLASSPSLTLAAPQSFREGVCPIRVAGECAELDVASLGSLLREMTAVGIRRIAVNPEDPERAELCSLACMVVMEVAAQLRFQLGARIGRISCTFALGGAGRNVA
jgi:hypothetical protein